MGKCAHLLKHCCTSSCFKGLCSQAHPLSPSLRKSLSFSSSLSIYFSISLYLSFSHSLWLLLSPSHSSPHSPLFVSLPVTQTTWPPSKMWLKRMISSLSSLLPSSCVPFWLLCLFSGSVFCSLSLKIVRGKTLENSGRKGAVNGWGQPGESANRRPTTSPPLCPSIHTATQAFPLFLLSSPFLCFSLSLYPACLSPGRGPVPLVHNHEQAPGVTQPNPASPNLARNWVLHSRKGALTGSA